MAQTSDPAGRGAYRTWKDLEAERESCAAEVAPDGFPWPADWRLSLMLARLYATPA